MEFYEFKLGFLKMRKKIGTAIESLSDEVKTVSAYPQGEVDLLESTNNTFSILNEIDMSHSQVDEAIEDLADLERVSKIVDGKMLDEPTIEASMVVLESISNRLGLRYANVSVESFRTSNGTNLSLEIFKAIKSGWDMIINFIKKIWGAIAGFYNSLFDTATKLRNKTEGLGKRLNEINFTEMEVKEDTFKDKSIKQSLIAEKNSGYENAEAVISSADAVVINNGKMGQRFISTLDQFKTVQKEDSESDINTLANNITAAFHGAGVTKADSSMMNELGLTEGVAYYTGVVNDGTILFANILSKVNVTAGGLGEAKQKNSRMIVTGSHQLAKLKLDDDDGELEVLTVQQMKTLNQNSATLAEHLEEVKKHLGSFNKVVNKIESLAKNAKVSQSNDTKDTTEKLPKGTSDSISRTLIKDIGLALQTFGTKSPAMAVKTVISAQEYIEKSLSMYVKKT